MLFAWRHYHAVPLTIASWLQVIEDYRNSFVTLALPLFASSEPVPMKKTKFKDMEWSLWDRWILQGDLTVQVCNRPQCP